MHLFLDYIFCSLTSVLTFPVPLSQPLSPHLPGVMKGLASSESSSATDKPCECGLAPGFTGSQFPYLYIGSHECFSVSQMVKNPPAIQETQIQSLGQKDPLEKELATHSSVSACRIPRTEEPGGLQSTGSQRTGHD